MRPLLIPLVLLLVFPAFAQESASYQLTEHTFNAGGNPAGGTVLTSTNYQITLDAIGDPVASRNLSSGSYQMEGGFVAAYPPPGEVLGVSFTDPITLSWDPEKSVGDYNLYRDLMSNLSGLGFGVCEQQEIQDSTTLVDDTHELETGEGYFYLVTAENRLDEEGTKGFSYDGPEREGTVCP
jgi:hypothetical protein